jgi:hypothetical protein
MAITLENVARSAAADAVVDLIDQGAGTATCVIKDGATTLATINLPNPAFGDASNGAAAGASLPVEATAVADGSADGFEVYDRDGTLLFSGTVTATGGGGDMTLPSVVVTTGEAVRISSFTYTAPAS